MRIEKGNIYHIYNQGNNKRKIFFSKRNYHFFISKMKTHLIPYSDIIAWCLMPNHFHIMLYVKHDSIFIEANGKERSINHALGIILRSYTRAINKQEKMSGSLFRKETKAGCVNCKPELVPNFFKSTINVKSHLKQYPQVCFDYIHQNPVIAGIVDEAKDWEFSSLQEYLGLKDENLICKKRANEFIDLAESGFS